MKARDVVPPSSSDRRIEFGLFLFTAVIYGYFFSGGGWNQNAHFDLTRAVVEQRTIQIDAYRHNTGDIAQRGGHVYANKAPGTSFLAAVPYALLYVVEPLFGIDPLEPAAITLNAYLCTFLTCGLLGAFIPSILYRYGRRHAGASMREALAIAIIIALGTPLLAYSTLLFLHVPSAALMLLAFESAKAQPDRPFRAGLYAGLAGLNNYLSLPAIALFVLLLWRNREGRERRLGLYVAGAVVPVLIFAWFQVAAFGDLFRIPITMNEAFVSEEGYQGIIQEPKLAALVGITVSRYRGMFYLSPALLMALGGLVVMARRRLWIDLGIISGICAIFFAFNLTFNNWEGGFGIGARYLVPVIPFLGLAMFYFIRVFHVLWIALAIISIVQNLAAVAVDPQPSGSISDPLAQYIYPLLFTGTFPEGPPVHPRWSPRLYTGHVSVNRHSMDQLVPFSKHPPGAPLSEWASFNLGELLTGPGTLLSLLPVMLWIVGGIVWLWRIASAEERRSG